MAHINNGNTMNLAFEPWKKQGGFSKRCWNERQIYKWCHVTTNLDANSSDLAKWLQGPDNPWPKATNNDLNRRLRKVRSAEYV